MWLKYSSSSEIEKLADAGSGKKKQTSEPGTRELYRDKTKLKEWAKKNPQKAIFNVSHFIDNIYKVHRPGKLTSSGINNYVPPLEIQKWAKSAQKFGVTDAFILLPERDMDEYYGTFQSGSNFVQKGSGKKILFNIYERHGIVPHHYPIEDYGTTDLSTIAKCCQDIKNTNAKAAQENKKLVIHCSAGVGRTGMVATCYLVYTDRLSPDDLTDYDYKNGKNLSPMQKLIKYDVNSQFNFIVRFANVIQELEEKGIDVNSKNGVKFLEKKDEEHYKELLKKELKSQEKWKSVKMPEYENEHLDIVETSPGQWEVVFPDEIMSSQEEDKGYTGFSVKETDEPNEYDSYFQKLQDSWSAGKTYHTPSYSNFNVKPVAGNLYRSSRPGYPRKGNILKDEIKEDIAKASAQGITDVISLLDDEGYGYYENPETLADAYADFGIDMHMFPIKDFGTPSIEDAFQICKFIDSLISSGEKVLIHCSAGIGRTGLIISCYLYYKGLVKPGETVKENPLVSSIHAETHQQREFIKEFSEYVNSKQPKPVVENQPNTIVDRSIDSGNHLLQGKPQEFGFDGTQSSGD